MDRELRTSSRGAQIPLSERHAWLNAATLESVQECNEHALELLRTQCLTGTAHPLLVRDVSDLLLNLNPTSICKAASSGVLLVDVAFGAAGRWSDAIVGAVNDRSQASAPFFTVDGAVEMMRQVLTHAWHLARSEPTAARLLLGLSPANLTVIGGCSLIRLTRLAEARSDWLRPRWENRPRIWCDLLRTAGTGDKEALERMRIRGLQLLAAEARQG